MGALSVPLKVPLGHGSQMGLVLVPPGATNQPGLQLQTLSWVEVPGAVCVLPAGQGVKGVHAVALLVVLNEPAAQFMQALSVSESPGTAKS